MKKKADAKAGDGKYQKIFNFVEGGYVFLMEHNTDKQYQVDE